MKENAENPVSAFAFANTIEWWPLDNVFSERSIVTAHESPVDSKRPQEIKVIDIARNVRIDDNIIKTCFIFVLAIPIHTGGNSKCTTQLLQDSLFCGQNSSKADIYFLLPGEILHCPVNDLELTIKNNLH